jgi:PKD repeat protein
VTLVNGKAIITPFMIDNGSSDETGIKQYTLSIDSFTCADIGKNTVTLTVTDSNDLSSSCTATVDVIGTIPVFSVLGELNKNGIFIGEQNIEVDSNQLFLGYGPQSFKLSCISTGNDTPFTYQWNGSGVTTPNAQNPIVVPTQEGTLSYQAIVTNKYGCTSSRSLELCVIDVRDPRPSKNNQKYIIICKLPPRNLPKPFSVSVPIDEVPALLAFGNKLGHCDSRCGGPTIEQLIGNPSSNSAVVFPNPASGSFNIQFQTPGMDKYVRVRLYDIRGELLYDNEYVDVFGVTSFGEELKSGLYIVEITEGGFNNIIKVIKLN